MQMAAGDIAGIPIRKKQQGLPWKKYIQKKSPISHLLLL
jgi:hypothetical protein